MTRPKLNFILSMFGFDTKQSFTIEQLAEILQRANVQEDIDFIMSLDKKGFRDYLNSGQYTKEQVELIREVRYRGSFETHIVLVISKI